MAESEKRIPVVFKEVFDAAIEHVDAESAVDIATDAVSNYLDLVGLSKPASQASEGLTVKLSNVEEIAHAVDKKIAAGLKRTREQIGPNLSVKNPGGGDGMR